MKPYLQQYFDREEVILFWPDEEVDTIEAILVSASGYDITSLMQEDRNGNGYIDYYKLEQETLQLLDRFCDVYNIDKETEEVTKFANFVFDGGLTNDVWDLYQNYPYYWYKVACLLDSDTHPLPKSLAAAITNVALWRSRIEEYFK